jgi:hypothetical protein
MYTTIGAPSNTTLGRRKPPDYLRMDHELSDTGLDEIEQRARTAFHVAPRPWKHMARGLVTTLAAAASSSPAVTRTTTPRCTSTCTRNRAAAFARRTIRRDHRFRRRRGGGVPRLTAEIKRLKRRPTNAEPPRATALPHGVCPNDVSPSRSLRACANDWASGGGRCGCVLLLRPPPTGAAGDHQGSSDREDEETDGRHRQQVEPSKKPGQCPRGRHRVGSAATERTRQGPSPAVARRVRPRRPVHLHLRPFPTLA